MEEILNWNGPMNFIFKSTFFLITLATCPDLDLVFSILDRVENPTSEMLHYFCIELIRRGNLPCLQRLLAYKYQSIEFTKLFVEAVIYGQAEILNFLFSLIPSQESGPTVIDNGKRDFLDLARISEDILYHAFDTMNISVFEILMDEKFLRAADLTKDRLEGFIRYNRCDIMAKIATYHNACSIYLFSKDLFFIHKAFQMKAYAFLMAFMDNNFVQPYYVAEVAVDMQDVFFLRKLYAKYNVGDNFYFAEFAARKKLYLVVEFFVLERGYSMQKLQGNSRRYMDLILRTRTRAANKIFFMVGQFLYSGKTDNLKKFVATMAAKSYDSLFGC